MRPVMVGIIPVFMFTFLVLGVALTRNRHQ
jgi:hypothetical protein